MSGRDLRTLAREWAALLAVLAFVLGPLALSVTRSLGASEKVAVAAGLKPLTLCIPAGPDGSGGTGPDCDHCTALQVASLAGLPAISGPFPNAVGAVLAGAPIDIAAFPRAPPARGPPTA